MFISGLILLFSEAGGGGTWARIYNDFLNVPGFEAWKFLNLIVFVGILGYLLKKPISEGFKAKREAIRAELIKAEEEKQAALAQLTAAEAKLAHLETEKKTVLEKAKDEATAEKKRQSASTDLEISRLREQAEGELARIGNQTRAELRRFSAEESIRLATEKLQSRIDEASDAKIVKANIQEIGGLN